MAEKSTENSVATSSSIPNWWSELHASCFSMEFKAASVLFLLLCSALVLSWIFVCSGAFSFTFAIFAGRLVCCPAGVLSCCCFALVVFLFCYGCLSAVPQFQLRPSSNKILIYPEKQENTINRWKYPKPNPNSSCEESVSISISVTNSSNHSGLSVDSSPPLFDSASTNELMGETASDNHLQNHVLGSSGSSGQLHNNHDAGEKLLDTIGMFEPAFDCLKKTENSWEFTNSTSFNNFEKHYDGFNESLIETEKLNKQSNLVSNWSIALPNLEVNPQLETRACNISFSSRTDQHSQSNLCDVKEKVSDSTAFVGGINRNSETVLKKPKNENPTVSSAKMRVPKVKMGDKITALQQIVSPFGRTDTASVLLEAIGYIKFLQGQIQILSNPYMETNVSKDPWGGLDEKDRGDTKLDLKGRGLCLVPITSIP